MLVDYISPLLLPRFVVWIDWNFYAYKKSLLVCVILVFLIRWFSQSGLSGHEWGLCVFIGFCCWNIWCFFRYGGGIG